METVLAIAAGVLICVVGMAVFRPDPDDNLSASQEEELARRLADADPKRAAYLAALEAEKQRERITASEDPAPPAR